jgi:phage repressor protein C with HTH and peptisase S24 domain
MQYVRMTAALIPFQRVRVSGPSMSPTLRDGDVVIVRHGAPVRPGDVVLGAYRSMPRRPVLKRAAHRVGDGWWLASDNEAAGGDSAIHGVADIAARVIVRFRRGSWVPRRVR